MTKQFRGSICPNCEPGVSPWYVFSHVEAARECREALDCGDLSPLWRRQLAARGAEQRARLGLKVDARSTLPHRARQASPPKAETSLRSPKRRCATAYSGANCNILRCACRVANKSGILCAGKSGKLLLEMKELEGRRVEEDGWESVFERRRFEEEEVAVVEGAADEF